MVGLRKCGQEGEQHGPVQMQRTGESNSSRGRSTGGKGVRKIYKWQYNSGWPEEACTGEASSTGAGGVHIQAAIYKQGKEQHGSAQGSCTATAAGRGRQANHLGPLRLQRTLRRFNFGTHPFLRQLSQPPALPRRCRRRPAGKHNGRS